MSTFGAPMEQPAGWYPDPGNPALMRWWDGGAWTNHVASIGLGPGHPPPLTPEGRRRSVVKVLLLCLLAGAAIFALLFGACLALFAGVY